MADPEAEPSDGVCVIAEVFWIPAAALRVQRHPEKISGVETCLANVRHSPM